MHLSTIVIVASVLVVAAIVVVVVVILIVTDSLLRVCSLRRKYYIGREQSENRVPEGGVYYCGLHLV